MPEDGGNRKGLFDRSLDVLRGVSDKVQQGATRAWRISGLRSELAALRRRRSEALRQLGLDFHEKFVSRTLIPEDLAPLSREIGRIDTLINSKQSEINQLTVHSPRQRAKSVDRAPRESRRLELLDRGPRDRGLDDLFEDEVDGFDPEEDEAILAREQASGDAPPVAGDPLEDILGTADETDLDEVETSTVGSGNIGPRRS